MKVTLVVKKHPDGYNYVPFDYDPHPDREAIVNAYIGALVQEGHIVETVKDFAHRPDAHPEDFHIKLVSGPRS